jgi:superfamily I DNA/RNA helicase
MRAPNSEQKLAIEHTGGVLLSAGAGSGKTFVLVEHVIYLASQFIEQNSNLDLLSFESKIQSYFSKIVLMTFTKKAAGEIYERMIERVEEQLEVVGESELSSWLIVKDSIDYMTISTIHGFCYKLIGQGLIPGVASTVAIISESESRERITKLFERWFENHIDDLPSLEFKKIISLNSRQITNAMINIFGSPENRIQWKELSIDNMSSDQSNVWNNIWSLLGVDILWTEKLDLIPFSEFSDKPWYKFLKSAQELDGLSTYEELNNLNEIFNSVSRLTGPSKKIITSDLELHFNALKEIRSFLKKYLDDIRECSENEETVLKDWWLSIKKIFDYIEAHYRDIPGFTFSDLEYYVSNALNDQSTIESIALNYQYFIVDEFQDTSEIQFEMLERIIGSDFKKLFTVGDMKQAIYGFRGGELGVFKECMEKSPQTLKLNNNYRSHHSVIDFNNYVFDYLFKLGHNYEGVDSHSVPVDYQSFPFDRNEENSGKIVYSHFDISSKIDEGVKPKSDDLSFFESNAIFSHIKNIIDKEPNEGICILYKNLGPSKYLINELIKNDIGFTAQVKVPLAEDPVLGIFATLVDFLLSTKEEVEKSNLEFLLGGYFQLLKISSEVNTLEVVEQFEKDILSLGVHNAFLKFLFSFGILNSNHKNNGQILREICEMCGDDIETIGLKLAGYSDVRYSIEFEYGLNTKRVQIMTAHASKGLEFDHVFLGGIHNNGRIMPELGLFGKMPWSFKWKKSSMQKKPFITPTFIYEGLLSKKKDFAESKRLFYVAATRAKKNLYWIDLNLDGDPLDSSKNSWVCGLRKWQENDLINKIDFMENLKSWSAEITDIDSEYVKLKAPLFHTDPLGLAGTNVKGLNLGIISELSVTRLATISQCPRKFYLLNVCKFSEDEIEKLTGKESIFSGVKKSESVEDENGRIYTSSERGTLIHEALSFAIKRNWIAPASFIDNAKSKDIDSFDWAINEVKKLNETHDLISEEPIKFPFFGQMISGTPDLVLAPKSDATLEIWDFKTGGRSEEKEVPYWFQLKAYAYAYQILFPKYQTSEVRLSLSFVDMKQNVSITTNFKSLSNELGSYWGLTAKPDSFNQEHCDKCTFGNLCHF